MNENTKIDLPATILPMLPREVDRWQAEIDFCSVQIKIHGDDVTIYPEKAPTALIVNKYHRYLQRIFPNKNIKIISKTGIAAMI